MTAIHSFCDVCCSGRCSGIALLHVSRGWGSPSVRVSSYLRYRWRYCILFCIPARLLCSVMVEAAHPSGCPHLALDQMLPCVILFLMMFILPHVHAMCRWVLLRLCVLYLPCVGWLRSCYVYIIYETYICYCFHDKWLWFLCHYLLNLTLTLWCSLPRVSWFPFISSLRLFS